MESKMENKKKNKISIPFQIYIIVWFYICLLIYQFGMGFIDGMIYGKDYKTTLSVQQVTIVIEIGRLFWIILAGTLFYSRIKKKVIKPIAELNQSMLEVSHGNLDVRIPVKAQFEFKHMQANFNYMVEELSRAAEEKVRQEQKNQQLYASIAHDLKTPMTMVKGYSKALQQKVALTQEKEMEYLQTIVDQTDHANNLLDELLAYTRLENQTYQLKFEQGDLAECLRTCVAGYYRELELHQMNLELEIPDESIVFSFDQLEMRRVFSNLISNMTKHNPEKTSCRIQLLQKDQEIQLIFADNGAKIEEDLEETLFDPFSVSDTSRNTKNGSGLGLSISKKIVERHHGRIFYNRDWRDGYKAFEIRFEIC